MLKTFRIFKYFSQKHLRLFYRSFCQSYDMKQHSTKVFRDIVNALGSFIQSLFLVPPTGNTAAANQAGKGLLRFWFLYSAMTYNIHYSERIFYRNPVTRKIWIVDSKDLHLKNNLISLRRLCLFLSRICFLLWYTFSSSNHIRTKVWMLIFVLGESSFGASL